jgi:hypothetical protein
VNTSRTRALLVLTFLLAASTAEARPAARSASARAAPGRGGQALSFWAVLDPGPVDGIGLGGRVMLPLVPEGVLHHHRIRDEFTLDIGADFVHYEARVGWPYYYDYSWNGFLPVVGATWNFWFTPDLALYPKLDLGYWFGWYDGPNGYGRADFDGLFLQGALGLIYRFQSVSLRVELGSGLLRIGLGIPF